MPPPPAPAPILRKIPSTGEMLPVIGIGTNAFGVNAPEEMATIRDVLQQMPALGGTVIDSAQAYGNSEEVIGNLLAELGNRDKYFLATKTPTGRRHLRWRSGARQFLQAPAGRRIDLLQIHNLYGLNELMPLFVDFKKAGKIRYIGVHHLSERAVRAADGGDEEAPAGFHPGGLFDRQPRRSRAVLPMAQDMGMRCSYNMPFGGRGRSFFPHVAGKPVPDFAKDIRRDDLGAVLPEVHHRQRSGDRGHSRQHHGGVPARQPAAGRGVVPDAAMRKRMEEYWDALPA